MYKKTLQTLSICVVFLIPNAMVYKSMESSSNGNASASACTHWNSKCQWLDETINLVQFTFIYKYVIE